MIERADTSTPANRAEVGRTNPGDQVRWLIGFWVVVACLFGTLVVVSWGMPRGSTQPISATLFLGTLTALSGLAGFWMGMGRRNWRFLVMPAFLLGLIAIACLATAGTSNLAFVLFVAGNGLTVFATSLGLRVWKGELRKLDRGEVSADALQFGTRDIFIWTAAVAVVVFLVQNFANVNDLQPDGDVELRVVGMAIAQAFSIVINVWVFFGRQLTTVKLLIWIGALVCVGFFNQTLFSNNGPTLDFLVVTVTGLIMFALPVFFLRRFGYRFVQR